MPRFWRSRKPETATQQRARPEPQNVNVTRYGETFIAPQLPRRVVPAPTLEIRPIPRARPHQSTSPSEVDASSEIITVPEPAALPSYPPTTGSESIRSFRPGSALYYCRYSEDGNKSELASHSGRDSEENMDGYCVFRERDLAANNRAEFLSPPLKEYEIGEEWKSTGEVSSMDMTILPPNFKKDPSESTDTLIRYPIGRRISAFTEVLSFKSSEDGQSTTLEEREIQAGMNMAPSLPRSDRILYLHTPWILRFIYIFILSNWWTLIPLLKISSNDFHPENLPLLYSCGMLIIIILSLGLQANYFRVHGVPWGRRRNAEKVGDENECTEKGTRPDAGPGPDVDLEARGQGGRATLKKGGDRRGWRLRSGMESYVFAVDMILFMLTLAALAVSIIFARHGGAIHEAQMVEAAGNATLGAGGDGVQGNLRVVEVYGGDGGYKLF
ncbi:hypothetical protein TWF679_005481 [Orbilia oligospora]|uniref:Uncharacterized protein n=1 Tax=Orbilia oligospora TaxID=2813651 RepID=A0A8H8VC81_ORBOL|nr:hypothetical protein TWF679_005481 [Orbilia oligospora]